MAETQRKPFAPRHLATEDFRVSATSPAPGVFRTQAEGHFGMAAVKLVTEAFDDLVAIDGKLHIFHDWAGVKGYTTEARVEFTEWSRPRAHLVLSAHVLIVSRILAMGISVANLVLRPQLQAYTSRERFEQARAVISLQRIAEAGIKTPRIFDP